MLILLRRAAFDHKTRELVAKHHNQEEDVTPLTNTVASFTPLTKLLIFVIQSNSLDNST